MTVKCNLILDSSCDLPRELWDAPGIFMVHLSYVLEGQEHVDDLFTTVSPHMFYEAMRQGACPVTSQASPADVERAFRAAIDAGLPAVYLAFDSAISGTYETSLLVLESLRAEYGGELPVPIHIVDTLLPSTPQGVLSAEAIRQRERGLTAEELVAWAEEARWFIQTIFMVDNFESLARGGRIPSGVAGVGDKLDVKPMLSVALDGKLTFVGVSRGRKKGLRRMADFCKKERVGAEPIYIGNADCPKDVERLKKLIQDDDKDATFFDSNIGTVIGSHVGPNMISLSVWGSDRRESMSVADRIANKVKRG